MRFTISTLAERVIAIGFVVGISALSAGCADNNQTIFIRQAQARDPGDGCVAKADPTGLFRNQGLVDTTLSALEYRAPLLVGNQLVPRGNSATLRTETSRVVFFEAEVEMFDFEGNSLGGFSQPVSGFADPSSGTDPGYGLVSATLADAATMANASAQGGQTIVSRVQIFGETLGGLSVETGLWDYPIFVCAGCLGCVEPESCDDELLPTCTVGQDDPIDCRCIGAGQCNAVPCL